MTGVESLGDWFAGLSRADLILGVVPLLFVGVAGIGTLLVDSRPLAVGVAALACCAVIGDGIYLNPPGDAGR